MSKKASEQQYKAMSLIYRGKDIFKPLNTGWIDDNVACVREYVANIFFYKKGDNYLMIDAGYNYDRIKEKLEWLSIDPSMVKNILITHQDTDHVGAAEDDSDGLFKSAKLYIGEIENRYLTGEQKRRVMFRKYTLPQVHISNEKVLVKDGDVFDIDGIKVEALLVPGHTWGHIVYLIDDKYLFTGDTIWFGADGGYSFINVLAEDNELAKQSLAVLEKKLRDRNLSPVIITGHTGWTDDMDFAFKHRDQVCDSLKKTQYPIDPYAPYDGYVEDDDTMEAAQSGRLPRYDRGIIKTYANATYLPPKDDPWIKKVEPTCRGYLKKRYGDAEGELRWKRAYEKYLFFWCDNPPIGYKDNMMSYNLYYSYALFAVYEACDRDFTPEDFSALTDTLITGEMEKLGKRFNFKKLIRNKTLMKAAYKYLDGYEKKVRQFRGNKWGNTWDAKVNPERHPDGLAFTMYSCPIAEFAKKYGYEDIAPCLCAMDFRMAELLGVELIRKETIAGGGNMCDYWYM